HDLVEGDRRGQQFEDRAGEAREVDSEGSVHYALREKRQHDEAGYDEGTVGHALDFGDAGADGSAEDHEIERSRDYRRHDALHQRTAGARHLEIIDRVDRAPVHLRSLTRPTKISSSELCVVAISLRRILQRSSSSIRRVTPRCSPWAA